MIDGVVLNCIEEELKNRLVGGRIDKITQPEKDELVIHIRSNGKKERLLLSAQASMPRVHLTSTKRTNPQTPPSYCMLLRKYIGNGRIVDVEQIGLERILRISIEQLNEMGDLCRYGLIIEIMGKHSNIILVDNQNNVLDSIKRIGANISSIRQVFPGREYILPPNQGKHDIRDTESVDYLKSTLLPGNELLFKSVYMHFTGISPFIANQIIFSAGLDPNAHISELTQVEMALLYENVVKYVKKLKNKEFQPVLLKEGDNTYYDYHALLPVLQIDGYLVEPVESISHLIDHFYEMRAIQLRMKQKTQDIRRLVQTSLERSYKKLDIQNRQLYDTKNMDKFKIRGELILANQYMIQPGMKEITVLNYYTNEELRITLDPTKTGVENANSAFAKYNKKKRTETAVNEQLLNTKQEIDYLESVKYSLENVMDEDEIEDIRSELMDTGFIRFKKSLKRKKNKSKPYHYISSDGFHMYVGKNNLQNEELSLKFASNSDWWFHTKDVPGSHVIVKCEGKELPDKTFEEAAALAAYYSKARTSTKVTVDYTLKRNLKKPNGSAPGYVIYHTNYSLFIDPSIDNLTQVV